MMVFSGICDSFSGGFIYDYWFVMARIGSYMVTTSLGENIAGSIQY